MYHKATLQSEGKHCIHIHIHIRFKKCSNVTHKISNTGMQQAFKTIIITRDLLDEMLRLFCSLFFQVRALKMEIRAGGGVLELGNTGGKGDLVVWEIQSGGS